MYVSGWQTVHAHILTPSRLYPSAWSHRSLVPHTSSSSSLSSFVAAPDLSQRQPQKSSDLSLIIPSEVQVKPIAILPAPSKLPSNPHLLSPRLFSLLLSQFKALFTHSQLRGIARVANQALLRPFARRIMSHPDEPLVSQLPCLHRTTCSYSLTCVACLFAN